MYVDLIGSLFMAMLHHTTYATPNDGWKYITFVEDMYSSREARRGEGGEDTATF